MKYWYTILFLALSIHSLTSMEVKESSIHVMCAHQETVEVASDLLKRHSKSIESFWSYRPSDDSNIFLCENFSQTTFLRWLELVQKSEVELKQELSRTTVADLVQLAAITDFLNNEPFLDVVITALAARLKEPAELEAFNKKNRSAYCQDLRDGGLNFVLEQMLLKKLKKEGIADGKIIQTVQPTYLPYVPSYGEFWKGIFWKKDASNKPLFLAELCVRNSGGTLFSCATDGTEERIMRSRDGTPFKSPLSINYSGTLVAVSAQNNQCMILDLDQKKEMPFGLFTPKGIKIFAWHPAENLLAVAEEAYFGVYDISGLSTPIQMARYISASHNLEETYRGEAMPREVITTLCWDDKGSSVITALYDRVYRRAKITRWDVSAYPAKEIDSFTMSGQVTALHTVIIDEVPLLLCGCSDGTVQVTDLEGRFDKIVLSNSGDFFFNQSNNAVYTITTDPLDQIAYIGFRNDTTYQFHLGQLVAPISKLEDILTFYAPAKRASWYTGIIAGGILVAAVALEMTFNSYLQSGTEFSSY